jgi:outer membrane protein, multidrug efflux system
MVSDAAAAAMGPAAHEHGFTCLRLRREIDGCRFRRESGNRARGSRTSAVSVLAVVLVTRIPPATDFLAMRPPPRRSGAVTLAVAGLAMLLAGCIRGEPLDPALDVPGRYRASREASTTAAPSPVWWRAFRSSELTRLAEAAEVGNLDIAAAIARIQQADAQARIAGASLLPTLDGSGSATRSRSADLSSGSRSSLGDRNLFSVGLQASYELDFWGRNAATLRAAEQNAAASRFDSDTVALTALSSTATTYFQILGAQERRRIANENLKSATRILTIIQERLQVGTATSLDLAQQQTVVANLRATIPPLDQQIEQDTATLAVLVGRAPERLTVRGGGLDTVTLPSIRAGLPSSLLRQRPDIASAEALLAAADANVDAARAAFFPTINLTGQGGFESLALKTLFNSGAGFYSIAAGLTQPIFEGFRLEGDLEQQRGRQVELLQNYRKSVISAFADVERALVAVRRLAEQERLLRESLASSRRAYEIAEQRLREGTVDLVTVLTTQQSLFLVEDAVAQTRQSRLLAAVSLYQALGGGWQKPDKSTP